MNRSRFVPITISHYEPILIEPSFTVIRVSFFRLDLEYRLIPNTLTEHLLVML